MTEPTTPSGGNLWDKIRGWSAMHPNLALTLAVFAALGPFLAKPFNIDDPLFIWAAHQIQMHPGNPYGFLVNWYDGQAPMWEVTKNPPLASYYLAVAAGILGWSEVALHFAFLLPAVAVILGTFRLAGHFCNRPMLAALATLFSPVFLISSTTIMCDVMMLAFWVWATVFWLEGLARDDFRRLVVAAVLVTLAALTKYFGICLLPLLLAHGLAGKRRFGWCIGAMLIPLAALAAYQMATKSLYGCGLLSDAGSYANATRGTDGFSKAATVLTALAFTGGCLATAVFFLPWLWRAKAWSWMVVGGVALAVPVLMEGAMMEKYVFLEPQNRLFLEIQIGFWAIGGISLLALAVARVLTKRDANSWLLALWVWGTFLFVVLFNWTVNGRTILPMSPAMGILLASRLDQNNLTGWKIRPAALVFGFGLGALLAMLTAEADFRQAVGIRQCARQVCAKYGAGGETLWFEGHWGFQYYMEAWGGLFVDLDHSPLKAGDYLALPWNNTNLRLPEPSTVSHQENIAATGSGVLSTMSLAAGSGFYASTFGPLPFAFGHAPSERVAVYVLKITGSIPPKK